MTLFMEINLWSQIIETKKPQIFLIKLAWLKTLSCKRRISLLLSYDQCVYCSTSVKGSQHKEELAMERVNKNLITEKHHECP